jgi:hypothetical protein
MEELEIHADLLQSCPPSSIVTPPINEVQPAEPEREEEKIASQAVTKSVLFSSFVGQSLKENKSFSGFSDIEKNKTEVPLDQALKPTKNKNHTPSISVLNEITSIFSRSKSSNQNTEKDISEERNENSTKAQKEAITTNDVEEKKSFLTNSIKNLPVNDFSSLFK